MARLRPGWLSADRSASGPGFQTGARNGAGGWRDPRSGGADVSQRQKTTATLRGKLPKRRGEGRGEKFGPR